MDSHDNHLEVTESGAVISYKREGESGRALTDLVNQLITQGRPIGSMLNLKAVILPSDPLIQRGYWCARFGAGGQ